MSDDKKTTELTIEDLPDTPETDRSESFSFNHRGDGTISMTTTRLERSEDGNSVVRRTTLRNFNLFDFLS